MVRAVLKGKPSLISTHRVWSLVLAILFGGMSACMPALATDDFAELWKTPLPQGTRGMRIFLQAISGRAVKPRTDYLLAGVVKVSRDRDRITFQREDSQVLELGASTTYGADLIYDLQKAERKALERAGPQAAQLVHNLSAISLDGQRVVVDIRSPMEQRIVLPERGGGWISVRLKEIRLRDLSMEIAEHNGHPALKKIEGLVAVVHATAFDLPFEIKEFSAFKDEEDRKHVHIGVKNLVPGPLRMLFGLPEVVSYDFVKKKKHRSTLSVSNQLPTPAQRSI